MLPARGRARAQAAGMFRAAAGVPSRQRSPRFGGARRGPEAVRRRRRRRRRHCRYGRPADIFSAGAVAVRLLSRPEFERGGGLTLRAVARDAALLFPPAGDGAGSDSAATAEKAAAGFLAGKDGAQPPPPQPVREFVRRMVAADPAARPAAEECAAFFRDWAGVGRHD